MKFFIKSFFQDPNFFIEIKKEMNIFFILLHEIIFK